MLWLDRPTRQQPEAVHAILDACDRQAGRAHHLGEGIHHPQPVLADCAAVADVHRGQLLAAHIVVQQQTAARLRNG